MRCSTHGTQHTKKCRECKELAKRANATMSRGKSNSGSGSALDWLGEVVENIFYWID